MINRSRCIVVSPGSRWSWTIGKRYSNEGLSFRPGNTSRGWRAGEVQYSHVRVPFAPCQRERPGAGPLSEYLPHFTVLAVLHTLLVAFVVVQILLHKKEA